MKNEIENETKNETENSKQQGRLVNCLYVVFFLFCIGACVYLGYDIYSNTIKKADITKKRQMSLEEFEQKGKEYYYEKYGKELEIKDSGSIYIEGMVKTKTKNLYIETTEGTELIYIEEKNQIYDNQQSDVIESALEETLKVLEDTIQSEQNLIKMDFQNARFNVYGEGTNVKGSFYHELFQNDINAFLEKEIVVASKLEFYAICGQEYGENHSDTENCVQMLEEEAKNIFAGFEESDIEISFLSEDCYLKYLENVFRKPNIDMEECYSKYVIGKENYSYVQNYIKVAEGIYITSAEKDFVLEENDIRLEESVSSQELNDILLENDQKLKNKEKEEEGEDSAKEEVKECHQLIPRTPVFRMQFSDRVKEFLNQKTYKELKVCIKFVPQEVGVTGNMKEEIKEENVDLTSMDELVRNQINEELELGKEASEKQKKELWQECKFYYYPVAGEGSQCIDIDSDMSDAEFALINEDDYYFGGYLIKIER